MVPRVCIKSLNLVLSIVDQPDGQVLICQGNIIAEVIDPRDGTDKLPCTGIVVISFIQQDPAEVDRQSLFGIAFCDGHGKGRPCRGATVAASDSSLLAHFTSLPFRSFSSCVPRGSAQPLQPPQSSSAYDTFTAFHPWFAWIPSSAWITCQRMWQNRIQCKFKTEKYTLLLFTIVFINLMNKNNCTALRYFWNPQKQLNRWNA